MTSDNGTLNHDEPARWRAVDAVSLGGTDNLPTLRGTMLPQPETQALVPVPERDYHLSYAILTQTLDTLHATLQHCDQIEQSARERETTSLRERDEARHAVSEMKRTLSAMDKLIGKFRTVVEDAEHRASDATARARIAEAEVARLKSAPEPSTVSDADLEAFMAEFLGDLRGRPGSIR